MDDQFTRDRGIPPIRAHSELPIPSTPLPGRGNPLPFDIDVEVRQFVGSSGDTAGAFFTLITVSSGVDVGDIHLQGGTVNGVAVATLDLKVYDASTGLWEGVDDDHLFLEVVGEGVITDGVLLPGFTVTTITPTIGAPSEHVPPTIADATGTAYLSLGVFFSGEFYPAAAGNREIAVCLGSFDISP